MIKKKLLLVTTVPETFEFILKGQPSYLSNHFDVSVASDDQPLLANFASEEGVAYYPIPMSRGINFWNDLKSLFLMTKLLFKIKPDVIHSYTPKAALVCALAGFIARVPIRIHTFTGLIFPTSTGVKKIVLKILDAIVCFLNTHIVPESNGVYNELLNITSKKMEVIGFGNIAGIDLEYFDPKLENVKEISFKIRNEYFLNDSITFCFVGRLNKDKGLNELCSAFRSLLEKFPCNLIIIGGLDNENPPDKKTLSFISECSNIHYFGFQRDVRPYILASDVLVLPSYREGFPNVLLQAGALGKPCLVTNVPGSNEIIFTNKNGWIVPARSSIAIEEKLQEIVSLDTSILHSMGMFAAQNVSNKYEKNFYRQKLLEFYKKL